LNLSPVTAYIYFYSSTASKKELNDCLSLNSEYVTKRYHGLVERLKEMPSEWTIIQITKNYNPKDVVTPRPTDKPTDVSELFISRYQCGQKHKNMYDIFLIYLTFI